MKMLKKMVKIFIVIVMLLSVSNFAYAEENSQLIGNFNESYIKAYEDIKLYVCDLKNDDNSIESLSSQCKEFKSVFSKCPITFDKNITRCIVYVENPKNSIDFVRTLITQFKAHPVREVTLNVGFMGGYLQRIKKDDKITSFTRIKTNSAFESMDDCFIPASNPYDSFKNAVKRLDSLPENSDVMNVIDVINHNHPKFFRNFPDVLLFSRACISVNVVDVFTNESIQLKNRIMDFDGHIIPAEYIREKPREISPQWR